MLEGGYDLDALAASVAETMEALGGSGEPPAGVERHSLADEAVRVLGRYWDSLNQLRVGARVALLEPGGLAGRSLAGVEATRVDHP